MVIAKQRYGREDDQKSAAKKKNYFPFLWVVYNSIDGLLFHKKGLQIGQVLVPG